MNNEVTKDFEKTMELIQNIIGKYTCKEDLMMYLNALELSVQFAKTTARQVFKKNKN